MALLIQQDTDLGYLCTRSTFDSLRDGGWRVYAPSTGLLGQPFYGWFGATRISVEAISNGLLPYLERPLKQPVENERPC